MGFQQVFDSCVWWWPVPLSALQSRMAGNGDQVVGRNRCNMRFIILHPLHGCEGRYGISETAMSSAWWKGRIPGQGGTMARTDIMKKSSFVWIVDVYSLREGTYVLDGWFLAWVSTLVPLVRRHPWQKLWLMHLPFEVGICLISFDTNKKVKVCRLPSGPWLHKGTDETLFWLT